MSKSRLTPAQVRALRTMPWQTGKTARLHSHGQVSWYWPEHQLPANSAEALLRKGYVQKVRPAGDASPARRFIGYRITQEGREALVVALGGPDADCKAYGGREYNTPESPERVCSLYLSHILCGSPHWDRNHDRYWEW
jgi:hypothetical protein